MMTMTFFADISCGEWGEVFPAGMMGANFLEFLATWTTGQNSFISMFYTNPVDMYKCCPDASFSLELFDNSQLCPGEMVTMQVWDYYNGEVSWQKKSVNSGWEYIPDMYGALMEVEAGELTEYLAEITIDGCVYYSNPVLVIGEDAEPPVIDCPSNQITTADVDCEYILDDYTSMAIVTDDCDPNPQVTQSPAPGTTISSSTIVTLTATDESENESSCSFSVNLLLAATPPNVTCPPEQTINANASCGALLPSYIDLVDVVTGCGSIQNIFQTPPASTIITGDTEVTVTVINAFGSDECSFIVHVADQTYPTVACFDLEVVANNNCEYVIPDFADVAQISDNCSIASVTQSLEIGSVVGVGIHDVSITATDTYGNATTCDFQITVLDGVPEITNCPEDQVLDGGNSCEVTLPDYTNQIEYSSCGSNDGSVSITQIPSPGSIISGIQLVTIIVDNGFGEADECEFQVTVVDNEAPAIVCPENSFSIPLNEFCEYELGDFSFLVTTTDNCSDEVIITQDPPPGSFVTGDSFTITFYAEDSSGNMSSCSAEIELTDLISPELFCPDIAYAEVGDDCVYQLEDLTAQIEAIDQCSSVSLTQFPSPGTSLEVGQHQITITGQDEAGNEGECSFILVVEDNTPPTITSCSEDIEIAADADCGATLGNYIEFVNAEDNCTNSNDITYQQFPSPGEYIVGAATVSVKAYDSEGNYSICTFDVIVDDSQSPIIDCPEDVIFVDADENCEYVLEDFTWTATATDNCGDVTINQFPSPGTVVSSGELDILLQAIDNYGNTSSCFASVYVNDIVPPTFITCLDSAIAEVGENCMYNLEDFTQEVVFQDDCSDLTVWQEPDPGTELGIGSYQVTVFIEDESGNSNECTFDVKVNDETPPGISCPPVVEANSDEDCLGILEDYTDLVDILDNCFDALYVSQSPSVGETMENGGQITLTAFDPYGNFATCESQVLVHDVLPPVLNCPEDLEVAAGEECVFTLPDYTGNVEVFEACSDFELWQQPEPGTELTTGQHEIWFFATDDVGNIDSCFFSVDVVDDIPPLANSGLEEINLVAGENCLTQMPNVLTLFNVSDNCDDDLDFLQFPEIGEMLEPGIYPGSIQVTDDYSNSFLLAFQVIVEDDQAPEFDCFGDVTINLVDECSYNIPDFTIDVLVEDCSEYSVEQVPEPGTEISADTDVFIVVTDSFGNQSDCSFLIDLVDFNPPTVTCIDDQQISVDESCLAELPDYTNSVEYSDNCSVENIAQNPLPGTMYSAGTEVDVTIVVTDGTGNTDQCQFVVEFIDEIAPEIICPENILVSTDQGLCGAEVLFDDPQVNDNCEGWSLSQIQGSPSGSFFDIGVHTITFQVMDDSNNDATCAFNIEVTDTEEPEVVCPNDIVSCENFIEFSWPTASDNCSTVEVLQTDDTGFSSGMDFPLGMTQLEYEAVDEYNNIGTCTLTITVMDNVVASWDAIPENICEASETINLNDLVDDGFEYTWSGDVDQSGILDPAQLSPGDYEITLQASVGSCEGDSTQTFSILAFPEISGLEDHGVCGLETDISCSISIGDFYWSGPPNILFEDDLSPQTQVTSSEFGVYQLIAVALNGECLSQVEVTVSFDEEPAQPDAGPDQDIYFNYTTSLQGNIPGIGGPYWWLESGHGTINDPTLNDIVITNLELGVNEFILASANGSCPTKYDTVFVKVYDLFIPSGFSPNGDNSNDAFEIKGLDQWSGTELVVFNRWGNQVFASSDYQNDWDGNGQDGSPLSDDTYFYIIKLNGEEHKGYVVLRR